MNSFIFCIINALTELHKMRPIPYLECNIVIQYILVCSVIYVYLEFMNIIHHSLTMKLVTNMISTININIMIVQLRSESFISITQLLFPS